MKKLAFIFVLLLLVLPGYGKDVILPNSGQLGKGVTLGKHKNIAITLRTTDGKPRMVYLYLHRSLPDGSWAKYYRIITAQPESKEFILPLKRGSEKTRSFRFTKGSKNCAIAPLNGGTLLKVSPYPEGGDFSKIKVTSLKLTNKTLPFSAVHQALIKKIEALPTEQPYVFKQLLPGKSVPAAGFAIVCGKSKTELFAAAELARYLKKITGKDFPINKKSDKRIVLKVVSVKKSENHRAEFSDGKNLIITGESERGLLYGVYDFLEKMCGVRFFAPFDYGEIVPSNPGLAFKPFKDEVKYCMEYRNSHYCSNGRSRNINAHRWQMADWAVKNRFNVELERIKDRKKLVEFYARRGGCIWLPVHDGHSYHRHIPPAKYFKTDPEFYCFEPATGKYRAHRAQLCGTNEKLFKEFGKVGDAYFKKYPYLNTIFIGQEDGSRLWCQCQRCLAITPKGEQFSTVSDRVINLANKAGAEIRKNNPDVIIGTYAYGLGVRPPRIIKPAPYVRVTLCTFGQQDKKGDPWKEAIAPTMIEWARLTRGNMMIYSYQYFNHRYLTATPEAQAKQFRMLYALKIRASHQETGENWAALDAWIMYSSARLAAQPLLDYKALRKDYYEKLYGTAAPEIMEVLDIYQNMLMNPANLKRDGFSRYPVFTADETRRVAALLKKAESKSSGLSRQAKAVNAQREYFDWFALHTEFRNAVDLYYQAPSQERFEQALRKSAAMVAGARKIEQKRVLSSYTITRHPRWVADFKTIWENQKKDHAFKKKYSVVRILENWSFSTDPHGKGEKLNWHKAGFDARKWKSIKAGEFWEKQGFADYDGAAWYRTKVTLPYDNCELYFAGVDEKAWVYVNGKYVGGQNVGEPGVLWQRPFAVKLNLPRGEYTITVRVTDTAGGGGIYKPVYVVRPKK